MFWKQDHFLCQEHSLHLTPQRFDMAFCLMLLLAHVDHRSSFPWNRGWGQMMSEQPVRLCLCGHCQQHWLQNGWVCPELLRPVGTMRTEQPPEDPWQEDPWLSAAVWGQDGWRRARGSTDGMTQGWNSWTDPWLEQDPWSEASATNGTWRRPREVYPRDARDPWEESTPAVGQREERWLEWTEWAPPRGDPWTAPGADPWGAYDPWADTRPEEWLRKLVCLKMG